MGTSGTYNRSDAQLKAAPTARANKGPAAATFPLCVPNETYSSVLVFYFASSSSLHHTHSETRKLGPACRPSSGSYSAPRHGPRTSFVRYQPNVLLNSFSPVDIICSTPHPTHPENLWAYGILCGVLRLVRRLRIGHQWTSDQSQAGVLRLNVGSELTTPGIQAPDAIFFHIFRKLFLISYLVEISRHRESFVLNARVPPF